MTHFPTIVAIATPPGAGAISLIRLSGPDAIAIADRISSGLASRSCPRSSQRCAILSEDGQIIDDGLMTTFLGPNSFTGEDSVEFTGHGGILVTREVLARFMACGATHASAGEFSQRAFINGKLDLTQAEAIMDLISAQSRLALRAAHSQLKGTLGKKTTVARDEVLATLANVEAWIDFPDEDIDPGSIQAIRDRIDKVISLIDQLLSTSDQGRILREGVRTVIHGPPNVGKSSLLNHLIGYDRAIVSEIAGTTRDTIEEFITLEGIPIRLVDTAGTRKATDQIELQGIERTQQEMERADLLIEVADVSSPKVESNRSTEGIVRIMILNKSDLTEHPSWADCDAIRLSCANSSGFEALASEISSIFQMKEADFAQYDIAINARHQASLQRAHAALNNSLPLITENDFSPEIASIDLREALDALGEIPGKLDSEDLLGSIFSQFCIGK